MLLRAKNCKTSIKIRGGTTQLKMVVKIFGFFGWSSSKFNPF